MNYNELVQTQEYWTTKIQLDLFSKVEEYMKENNLSRSDFAKEIGVSKGYVTQILNGDFDHRVSKLVELSLAIGYFPHVEFKKVKEDLSGKTATLENIFKQLELTNHNEIVYSHKMPQDAGLFERVKSLYDNGNKTQIA